MILPQRHEAFTPCKKKACRRACRRVRQVMQKAPTHTAQHNLPAAEGECGWFGRERERGRTSAVCRRACWARRITPGVSQTAIPGEIPRIAAPPPETQPNNEKAKTGGGIAFSSRGLQTGNHCTPRARSMHPPVFLGGVKHAAPGGCRQAIIAPKGRAACPPGGIFGSRLIDLCCTPGDTPCKH